MKYSAKALKRHATPQAKPQPAQAGGPAVKRWSLLAACLVLATGGTWVLLEFVVWNKLPTELVGQWEVVQGPDDFKEAEFQFYRSGKMIGHFNDNGMDRPIDAHVRVEAGKLYITTRQPSTNKEHVTVHSIRTLNERELVLADEHGNVMKLARIP